MQILLLAFTFTIFLKTKTLIYFNNNKKNNALDLTPCSIQIIKHMLTDSNYFLYRKILICNFRRPRFYQPDRVRFSGKVLFWAGAEVDFTETVTVVYIRRGVARSTGWYRYK